MKNKTKITFKSIAEELGSNEEIIKLHYYDLYPVVDKKILITKEIREKIIKLHKNFLKELEDLT